MFILQPHGQFSFSATRFTAGVSRSAAVWAGATRHAISQHARSRVRLAPLPDGRGSVAPRTATATRASSEHACGPAASAKRSTIRDSQAIFNFGMSSAIPTTCVRAQISRDFARRQADQRADQHHPVSDPDPASPAETRRPAAPRADCRRDMPAKFRYRSSFEPPPDGDFGRRLLLRQYTRFSGSSVPRSSPFLDTCDRQLCQR